VVACVFALGLVMAACGDPSTVEPRQAAGPVIAAVGDIACKSLPSDHERRCRYNRVAEAIREMAPDAFLALGDLQYLHGAYEDFIVYYDRYFAELKDITHPVPGNHETYTLYAEGYYRYFGDPHPPGGWYSFDLGSWHLVALNSQLCKGSTWTPELGQRAPITTSPAIDRGCGPGTPEYEWLKKDLVTLPARCTLAFMHHPLFGSKPYPEGVFLYQLQPLYELLDEQGVDVVLAGHEHNYQRFAPMDAFGRVDPDGLRCSSSEPAATRTATCPRGRSRRTARPLRIARFGVLRMVLGDREYSFEFVTAPDEREFTDAGGGECV
jgi:3',5'-cyclic AMP phosphodiesterase CpdA